MSVEFPYRNITGLPPQAQYEIRRDFEVIARAIDGPSTNLALRSSGTSTAGNAAAYGAGAFVVLGNGGVVSMVSTNGGVSWSALPTATQNYYHCTYGGGMFVAPTPVSLVGKSVDGVTWSSVTGLDGANYYGIAYGVGKFVIAADLASVSKIVYSTDAITWSSVTLNLNRVHAVAYGNGVFVAFTNNFGSVVSLYTSTDGVTWTNRTYSGGVVESMAFGNGIFLAWCTDGSCISSTDGITWTTLAPLPITETKISFCGDRFLICSNNSVMFTPDGVSRTSLAVPTGNWRAAAYGDGVTVVLSATTAPILISGTYSFDPAPGSVSGTPLAASAVSTGNIADGAVTAAKVAADVATQAELDAEAALARNADNLTSGTVADARIASTIARDTEVATAVSDHAAAADPHTGYQKESEKNAQNGYAGLDNDADARVPAARLATGTPDGTKFLRDDRTWQAAPTGDETLSWISIGP